jgi:hypothetical protein
MEEIHGFPYRFSRLIHETQGLLKSNLFPLYADVRHTADKFLSPSGGVHFLKGFKAQPSGIVSRFFILQPRVSRKYKEFYVSFG